MPSHSPEEIISIVDAMELARSELFTRMDGDMDLYHQEPYVSKELAGFKHYTSNNPTTTMNLALHMAASSKWRVRVHQARVQKEQREVNNFKELFAIGIRAQANERRANLLQPGLQEAAFAQSLFRGRISRRVLLVKKDIPGAKEENQRRVEEWQASRQEGERPGDEGGLMADSSFLPPPEMLPETRTYPDVTDWDPRNTYWGMGPDGLAWACNKEYKSRSQIIAEYGEDPAEDDRDPVAENDDLPEYAVYDWFDETDNMVILG